MTGIIHATKPLLFEIVAKIIKVLYGSGTHYDVDIHCALTAMQTIAILPEPTADSLSYRATCGQHQATGQTPGQALDTLEAQLATTNSGETLIILQRFRPDDLFTAAQQKRLRKLMDQFQAAIAQGTQLEPTVQAELDTLVEAELEANIKRSQRLLQQRDRSI
jgi:hypothetical protein